MTEGPLGRARQELLDARSAQALKDSPANRQAVEDARATLDAMLDEYPHSPHRPGAQTPGPVVSPSLLSHEAYKELYCPPGDSDSGAEQ